MSYFEMNEEQVKLLFAMTVPDSDTQVILKPRADDPPDRIQAFTQLNKDTDELIEHGFCEELADVPPKPPNYPYDFRMVRITDLGRALFNDEKGNSVRAV